MEILFLGLLFKEDDENIVLRNSKVGLNNSTNTFQWSIIKGITYDKSVNIKILNSIPYGNFPLLSSKLFVRQKKWIFKNIRSENKEIGYINFYYIKHIIRSICFMREVKEWLKTTQGSDRCIILYDMYVPFMKIVKWVKHKYPDVKTNIIIGDLPNEYSHNYEKYNNSVKGIILNKRGIKGFELIKYFDTFVFLTKYMRIPLKVKDKPYVVIEGVVDNKCKDKKLTKFDSDKKIIMYAGTLNKQYGIDTLLEAFNNIENKKYELWLCGNGDMKSQIIDATKKDKRIKYYGYVSRSKLTKMEKEITVYVNPRKNIGAYTKYSFPSKTIEYLASGKPIVMYKLDGIPDEYDQFLFYVKGNSSSSLSNKLIEVCNKSFDELYEAGLCNQDFVFKQKNNITQANKLLAMLGSKNNGKV